MGIEGLLKTIKDNYPEVVQTINLEQIRGYRVAVDMSIYFYQFIRTDPRMWKKRLVDFLVMLKRYEITPVCIFDGPNPPKEKTLTQMARREQTQKYIEKLENCKKHLKKIERVLYEGESLNDSDISAMKEDIGVKRQKTVDWEDNLSIQEKLSMAIINYEKQTSPVKDEDKECAREIIEAFGFPSMVAHGEAEGLCSFLTHKNCDAVLTEDSDVLVYGAKLMIFNLKIKDETANAIVCDDLLRAMKITRETFLDLCIFLGCDYNKDVETGKPFCIKGYDPSSKMKKPAAYGHKKRWALFMDGWVTKLEEAEQYFDDLSVVKYERIREIFTTQIDDIERAPYSIYPDKDKLEKLFKKHKIATSVKSIEDVFEKANIEYDLDL